MMCNISQKAGDFVWVGKSSNVDKFEDFVAKVFRQIGQICGFRHDNLDYHKVSLEISQDLCDHGCLR